MSYEFRNPLTTIGGFAEMLANGAGGKLSREAGEYVDAILTSVGQLPEQVENVLDLSQSEAGLMPIDKQKLELLPFLTDLVREREQVIVEAGLGLDLKGRKGRFAMADERQLGRALGNLLDNAIAGTPPDEQIVIEIKTPAAHDGWGAHIIITDNGDGMSAEKLSEVMGTASHKVNGRAARSGLGVPLARQLIEAHGGVLEMMSEEGEGTSAIVRLP